MKENFNSREMNQVFFSRMSDVKLTKEQKKAAKAARRAQALAERGDDGEAKKAEALKNVI